MFSIFIFLHKSSIIEFLYSVPMSVMNVFIGSYFRIKFSNIALATVFALLSGIGIVARHFVKSQINVTAYSFPVSDLGSGPIVSTMNLSKALCWVSVIVNGVWVCLVDLDF